MTLRRRGGRLRRGTTGASLAGFVLWLVALTIVHDGPAHTPVLVAGSLTVAAALAAELWLAHRERHDCECHVCASGADEITPAERAALG